MMTLRVFAIGCIDGGYHLFTIGEQSNLKLTSSGLKMAVTST